MGVEKVSASTSKPCMPCWAVVLLVVLLLAGGALTAMVYLIFAVSGDSDKQGACTRYLTSADVQRVLPDYENTTGQLRPQDRATVRSYTEMRYNLIKHAYKNPVTYVDIAREYKKLDFGSIRDLLLHLPPFHSCQQDIDVYQKFPVPKLAQFLEVKGVLQNHPNSSEEELASAILALRDPEIKQALCNALGQPAESIESRLRALVDQQKNNPGGFIRCPVMVKA